MESGQITVKEAAERLERSEDEVWRMLEDGTLPALLRGDLSDTRTGDALGFDYALLPPEGVARVVDQGGDDFTLEWFYFGGNYKAVCYPARKDSIRVLWDEYLINSSLQTARHGPECIEPNQDPAPQAAPAAPQPMQRQAAQEAVILEAILSLGHDPKALPAWQHHKGGVKAETRQALAKNPMFAGSKEVFKKAWQRLRKAGEIAET